ncbi:MAG: hypothetical protein IJL70_03435 [Treponema sp.]|nr:hypothetical protein [Treponema sp.]
MNTIPSTFNEYQIDRTVLGGKQQNPNAQLDLSVIMLNSNGSHLKGQYLENLLNCGVASVVSVEPNAESYSIEDVSRRFPAVKFLIPREKTTDGVLINMAMSELNSKYVLVLRDSIHIPAGFLSKNLVENLMETDVYCIVPRLLSSGGTALITNFSPSAIHGSFRMYPNQVTMDGLPTLYPFNFVGLYNREKFIRLGGFDYTITSSYWQNADLSVRSWIWGEKTVVTTKFQLSYIDEVPLEDTKPDLSYLRFYLKNILPKFKADHGQFSYFSFPLFFFKSSCGIFEAFSQFNEAKNWVSKNKYRFQRDIQYLIENWTDLK